jgi:hypothetical protein
MNESVVSRKSQSMVWRKGGGKIDLNVMKLFFHVFPLTRDDDDMTTMIVAV